MKVKPIDELTGIRFFAALHVLFFHTFYLSGTLYESSPDFIKRMVSLGDSAVSFFFILSGFILTYVYTNKDDELRSTPKSFAWARFSRLYPVYLLGLILDLPRGLSYFFNEYSSSVALKKVAITLVAYMGMFQSWHPRLTAAWNSPGWSLSDEIFFYLLFPFVLPLVLSIKKDLFFILTLYLLPIILYFLGEPHFDFSTGAGHIFWRSFPPLRLGEFLLGIFIGKTFIKELSFFRIIKKFSQLFGLLFWLILFFSLFIISVDFGYPREVISHTFLVPCFSLMILILSSIKVPFTAIFRDPFILLLGNASFTLYIIHMPLLFYIYQLGISKGLVFFILYLLVSLLLSLLVYKWFEIPLQRFFRRKYTHKG